MSKLHWDADGERRYETGVNKGVLYLRDDSGKYKDGVAWNGLTGATESPSGAEPTDLWADNMKYLTMRSAEDLGATITAYTYPDEFGECDGSATIAPGMKIGQQSRRSFGLCYQTAIGNDVAGNDYGYKIHILYGCTASPSERAYSTINDSPEAIEFSWELTTTPVAVEGYKPTSIVTIESTDYTSEEAKKKLQALEDKLYGTEDTEPTLLLPDEIKALLTAEG